MDLNQRITAFAELGATLREGLAGRGDCSGKLGSLIDSLQVKNPWFTPENVRMAVKAIAGELTAENLVSWTSSYPSLNEQVEPRNIAVIMAGNIPAVGFHDMLSVLISGHRLIAKTSSKDVELPVFLTDILCGINEEFRKSILITDGQISGFDAVIATGSDNSARYFDYYFGKYPNIIRKNRNSVAILEGNETSQQLAGLGTDVFSYFGLGCRNVSKIYIPEGYDINLLTTAWQEFGNLINHSKYANNYEYNKAIYLVNREPFTDAGYLLLKKDSRLSSPVAVLYYDHYADMNEVRIQTEALKDKIQCITGKDHLPFGSAQFPHLWDYADGIDTLRFLSEKKLSGNILL